MTSQNIEDKIKTSCSATGVNNNVVKVGRSVLMKERNRNQINTNNNNNNNNNISTNNNNNILLVNRTVAESECNVKGSNILRFAPTTNNLSKLLEPPRQQYFDSDVEIIEDCDNEKSESKGNEANDSKKHEFVKKETPLLQIFDGNVVISQELSLEEVQNLLFQINSKLQNQNNVSSEDFPNTTFSTEENSDVEIILETGKGSDADQTANHPVFLGDLAVAKTSGKWISEPNIASNNRKLLFKPLSVREPSAGKPFNRASTSAEPNFFISFKTSDGRKSGGHGFEHDYSSVTRPTLGQNDSGKNLDPAVVGDQLMVDTPDAELMQIEVIESSGGPTRASTVSATTILTDKDGEPIKLPDSLESVPKAENFPTQRHRWNTNEEIAAILISFEKHNEWQSKEVIIRPKSGSMLLYSRKKVRYRRDGYCWKKRKDGKTTREDHMKLKVQGTECIYGCYVHSAILPTFHRRCYWLLQNPDIVLVHYLNVPYPDDNKLAVLAPSLALWGDKKEWTKEELVSQLKPMFYSEQERDLNELEISTAETVEVIVAQLMEKQRVARAATLSKQLECGCPDSTCADSKTCSHPMRRITAANMKQESNSRVAVGQVESNNQVSSTTGSRILLNKANTNGSNLTSVHHRANRNERTGHGPQPHPSSLVLSLSQIHSSSGLSLSQIQDGTNLLILNNSSANANSSHPSTPVAMVTSFKCTPGSGHHQPPLKQYHHPRNKIILKHETVDGSQLSCCRMAAQDPKITNQSSSGRSGSTSYSNGVFPEGKAEREEDLNPAPISPSKSMDTCENSGDTILILNTSSGNRVNALSSVGAGSSFYNETLDLSQEDIQRTLSANLPLGNFTSHRESSHSKSPSPCNTIVSTDVMVPEINPMELMDSPPTVVDDDVFVNLDAFDMLSDFPELEVLDHQPSNAGAGNGGIVSGDAEVSGGGGGGNSSRGGQSSERETNATVVKDESSSSNIQSDFRESSASITDFSPEWAYPEGGVKVLVTGPWYSSTSRYTVLFDSFPVPTTLVQSGVLRCFCPAHEVGLATVQVACEGFVISNSVMFEYKRPPHDDSIKMKDSKLEDNENLLKFTLLERLEAVDGRLHIKEEPEGNDLSDSFGLYHQSANFEEKMVNYCQDMTNRKWRAGQETSPNWTSGLGGMTLLHLAASLGYARLVCTLLHWRAENSSLLLDMEIDALSQDDEGFTPLMWACGRGHRETALVLYRWNHMALHVHNCKHQTALSYARAKGQTSLAKELEDLEASREKANMTLLSTTSNTLDRLTESDGTPSQSPTSSTISLNSSKSHDGIFLRPDPVAKSEARFKTFSAEPGSSFSDRSKTPSPTPALGDFNENHRLVKRPSVDSGINLGSYQSESFPTLCSSGKLRSGAGEETPKLSRCDRSLSLPSSASCESNHEADGRRMDFALCEVTAPGPSSKNPSNAMDNLVEDDADVSGDNVGEEEVRVLTLAEQIIAAIPERIKNESEEMQLDDCPPNDTSLTAEVLSDTLMEPFLDEPSSTYHPSEFNFEFSDHNYRYYDVGTPSSSLSPGSSSLQSPSPGFPIDSPSPPPTTQDFCEFFQASGSLFEKDFSNLTLSDREQRELYQAAKIIQKAYRSYKGRKKLAEDKERAAAILIQNYYRRYKQYAYFKQMTHAAMVIQNGYRSYCEHKRFKKSQEAAVCIQNYYRHYKEQGESKRSSRETTPSTGLKRTYSQRRQHQAACKIQQFMRQSKNKLQKERTLAAEKERLDVRQSSQDARRKSLSQDSSARNNRCFDHKADHEKDS